MSILCGSLWSWQLLYEASYMHFLRHQFKVFTLLTQSALPTLDWKGLTTYAGIFLHPVLFKPLEVDLIDKLNEVATLFLQCSRLTCQNKPSQASFATVSGRKYWRLCFFASAKIVPVIWCRTHRESQLEIWSPSWLPSSSVALPSDLFLGSEAVLFVASYRLQRELNEAQSLYFHFDIVCKKMFSNPWAGNITFISPSSHPTDNRMRKRMTSSLHFLSFCEISVTSWELTSQINLMALQPGHFHGHRHPPWIQHRTVYCYKTQNCLSIPSYDYQLKGPPHASRSHKPFHLDVPLEKHFVRARDTLQERLDLVRHQSPQMTCPPDLAHLSYFSHIQESLEFPMKASSFSSCSRTHGNGCPSNSRGRNDPWVIL